MRLRTHMGTGGVIALALAPWLRRLSIPLWIGATFADADLYAYYVVRHHNLSVRRAVRYYHTLTGRRERAAKLLHYPLVPMVAIAGVRRCPPLAAFGIGVALHLLLDACEKDNHRRLRQTLEVRCAGYCEACAERQRSPALMEPLYTGKQNGKEDFDPAHWRLVCRPCNDIISGCGAEP